MLSKPVKARLFFGSFRVGLAGAGREEFGVGLADAEDGRAGIGGVADGGDGGMEGVPEGSGGVEGFTGVTGVGGVEGPGVSASRVSASRE